MFRNFGNFLSFQIEDLEASITRFLVFHVFLVHFWQQYNFDTNSWSPAEIDRYQIVHSGDIKSVH